MIRLGQPDPPPSVEAMDQASRALQDSAAMIRLLEAFIAAHGLTIGWEMYRARHWDATKGHPR